MQADTAARIFYDWACSEGLVIDGGTPSQITTAAEMALIDQISDISKDILRRRLVEGILFNEAQRKIIVQLHKAKPTKKQISVLPGSVDDVAIDYRQGTQLPIGSEPLQPYGGPPFTIRQAAGLEYYACGSSISIGNNRDAGTLGCLVADADGTVFGLTNNHVSGGCSYAPLRLPILAPGVLDVVPFGCDPFTIGHHERALEMVAGHPEIVGPENNTDAAIFKLVDPNRVTSFQGSAYDTPTSVTPIAPDMVVEKVGRTTGRTTGKIMGQRYGAVGIKYGMDLYSFSGVVYFSPVFVVQGNGGIFSDSGDSGSLVTTVDAEGQRHAIGLIVGGGADRDAAGGKITLILPIGPMLERLGVALIGGHNA